MSQKEENIQIIRNRILTEHNKHKDLDWAQIAAQKIVSTFPCLHSYSVLNGDWEQCEHCGNIKPTIES